MPKKTEAVQELTQAVRRRSGTLSKLKRRQERAWANRGKTEKLLTRINRMERTGLPPGTVTETKKISSRISAVQKVLDELIKEQLSLERAYVRDHAELDKIKERVGSFVDTRLDDFRDQIVAASSSSVSRFRTDFTDAPMTNLCTNLFRPDESQIAAAAAKIRIGKGGGTKIVRWGGERAYPSSPDHLPCSLYPLPPTTPPPPPKLKDFFI